MTLHPRYIPDVSEETVKVAKAVFRKGNHYMQIRDELGTLFNDEQVVDLFPNVRQLAESAWRFALVTVIQFAKNLTDRQVADALRARIDWKYAKAKVMGRIITRRLSEQHKALLRAKARQETEEYK